MRRLAILVLWSGLLCAQSQMGELRLRMTDPTGSGLKCSVELRSESSQFRQNLTTSDSGFLDVKQVPFGLYQLKVQSVGFAAISKAIEIRSEVPQEVSIKLNVVGANESVTVSDNATLIDPEQAGSVNQIGLQSIEERKTSLPGRSVQDLVDAEPGWLYEGNAVLHPRGAEYQTQIVVNGIPLTDNRSPGLGPEIEADNVESMSVYTAGIPAEYGRKMGGIVELNTERDPREGFHGQLNLSGGSFDTAGAYTALQYLAGKNLFAVSADGDLTSRYLSPPVPENYTNTATLGDFSGDYEREFTPSDRLTMMYRHELSRFQIPNEQVQQNAGQQQYGNVFEDMGTIAYQHIFSSQAVGDLRGMIRDNSNGLSSNLLSTPIIAFQQNHFAEGYFKGSVAIHHGRNEWKAGIESDNLSLHENFADTITDPSQFDAGTPTHFSFAGTRPDLEQSAYVQDMARFCNWTLSAG